MQNRPFANFTSKWQTDRKPLLGIHPHHFRSLVLLNESQKAIVIVFRDSIQNVLLSHAVNISQSVVM